MLETVTSANGVTIRLTDERWAHITEEHSELAGMRFDVLETVAAPEKIYKGNGDELFAVAEIDAGKFLWLFIENCNQMVLLLPHFLLVGCGR